MATTEKTCFKCNVIKPITDFYVHPQMGDGRLNKCKQCSKKDVSRNYYANIDHYKEYERGRANAPHRLEIRANYAATENGKLALRRGVMAWVLRNPAKRAAQIAVGNAIRDGKIRKQPCEICSNQKAQAHHDDYSKPLEVRWLCTTHHSEWHKHNKPKCPDKKIAA